MEKEEEGGQGWSDSIHSFKAETLGPESNLPNNNYERGKRKLCIIIYVNYSITFVPPGGGSLEALPTLSSSPTHFVATPTTCPSHRCHLCPIINSEHKCASLINMKRQCARGAGNTIEAQLELKNWRELERQPGTSKELNSTWLYCRRHGACRKDYARNQYSSGPQRKGSATFPETRAYSSDCVWRGVECSSRGWTVLKFK